jgi:hypothetical protein
MNNQENEIPELIQDNDIENNFTRFLNQRLEEIERIFGSDRNLLISLRNYISSSEDQIKSSEETLII